ncbi:hypothetical protein CSAL01_10948 [Colletotrichum salicis]|uniref:Uncharacterized protein n=1 Tax=Colletotrichum salicis TaxID=1209931 RepID=A0A135UR60_9PEZI|nr:hypothetical protein CSAL01_10948 [Colletotrichum salicis]
MVQASFPGKSARNSDVDESLHFGGQQRWPEHPTTATPDSLGRGAHYTDTVPMLAASSTEFIAHIARHGSVSDQSLAKQDEASRNDDSIAVPWGRSPSDRLRFGFNYEANGVNSRA